MRASYDQRKAAGLCPRCGGSRSDQRLVMCESCREEELMRYYGNKESQRRASAAIRDNGPFMGLHVWLCQQDKIRSKREPEYSI